MTRVTIILYCYVFCLYSSSSQKQVYTVHPQVTLELGTLRGFYQEGLYGKQIASFQSLPYAKQPIGRHRFKDSLEINPWLGIYDATGEPPDCLQLPPAVFGPITGSEDCLYINVYTPYVPSGTEVRPLLDVLVYIHGGGFMYYGSRYFTPKYLLEKDIVLVTFNYRLGPLGFLSTGDNVMPGNTGMKDQVMALRWVNKYISYFGGDPNKVTISGHSAGGASVHYHLLSPLSKGLFQKAIISSGTALNPWAKAERLQEKTFTVAEKLGCVFQETSLLVNCLKSRPTHHVVDFSKSFKVWNSVPMAPWAPIVEPKSPSILSSSEISMTFLEDDPLKIIMAGLSQDVPVMFTYTSNEGSVPAGFFVLDDKSREELSSRWDELIPHVLDFFYTADIANFSMISQLIKQHYFSGINIADKSTAIEPLTKMIGDRLYVSGIAESAKLHAQINTSPVYTVRLSYKSDYSNIKWACNCTDNLPGALHCDDAGLILGHSFLPITSDYDNRVRGQLIDLWYSFMTGKPQYGSSEVPEVKSGLPSLTFLDIDHQGNPSILTEKNPGQLTFWKSLPIF